MSPLVSTYSIAARDPESGDLGVAVQSHYFGVGPVVPWAEPGVAAIATQAMVDVGYGPRGLDLIREGLSAPAALEALLQADPGRERRQVAMVDAAGRVAAHTGSECIPVAGHYAGEQYSVQANMMHGDGVVEAMRAAYETAKGPLGERLLGALDAAEARGGDIRGRQSAALVVVRAERPAERWTGRKCDLRVEDHPEPLAELRRLYQLRRAYDLSQEASAALARGDRRAASAGIREARALAGPHAEITFWWALALAASGAVHEAAAELAPLFREEPRWADLLARLPRVGMLPEKTLRALRAAIAAAGPGRAPR